MDRTCLFSSDGSPVECASRWIDTRKIPLTAGSTCFKWQRAAKYSRSYTIGRDSRRRRRFIYDTSRGIILFVTFAPVPDIKLSSGARGIYNPVARVPKWREKLSVNHLCLFWRTNGDPAFFARSFIIFLSSRENVLLYYTVIIRIIKISLRACYKTALRERHVITIRFGWFRGRHWLDEEW